VLDLKSPMDPALSTVVAGMNHVAGERAVDAHLGESPRWLRASEPAVTTRGNQRGTLFSKH
jgi:hypothetical protein